MTSWLTGCVVAEAIIATTSATAAYYSHKANQTTLYTADCAAEMLNPDLGYNTRWTDNEKRQLLAHVRYYQENCPEN